MKSRLQKIGNIMEKSFSWFSLFILLVMLLITVAQIILRNFFDINFTLAGEIARQGVIWLTFAGAVLTTLKNKHIAIDLLSRIISQKYKKKLLAILNISAAVICFILTYFSINFLKMEIEFASTIADKIPAWTFQVIIPAGFFFMALAFLLNIFTSEEETI